MSRRSAHSVLPTHRARAGASCPPSSCSSARSTASCRSPGCSWRRPSRAASCSPPSRSRPGTGLLDNLRDLFSYGGRPLPAVGGQQRSSTRASAPRSRPSSRRWRGTPWPSTSSAAAASVLRDPRRRALPGITLAIPQYLLMSQFGLAGSYWSVLLPASSRPFGIYLARVYAGVRSRRDDGGGPDRRGERVSASSARSGCR